MGDVRDHLLTHGRVRIPERSGPTKPQPCARIDRFTNAATPGWGRAQPGGSR
jgi:hypothetical protein